MFSPSIKSAARSRAPLTIIQPVQTRHAIRLGQPAERHEQQIVRVRRQQNVLLIVDKVVVNLVGKYTKSCSRAIWISAFCISGEYTAPVGLFGLITTMPRVLGVILLRVGKIRLPVVVLITQVMHRLARTG